MLIRPARPDEYDEIGELAVRVYLAERYTRPGAPYLAVLRDATSRAEKAELMVAVGEGDRILGTVSLTGEQWVICILSAATILVASELQKLVLRRRTPDGHAEEVPESAPLGQPAA